MPFAIATLMYVSAPLAWAAPWVLIAPAALYRASRSRALDDVPSDCIEDAPLVSVVVPARNERRNIGRCVRSLLATAYPRCEVIVVDDHSEDGTFEIARATAEGDERLRVISALPLPDGWLGKQWACMTGAAAARGDWLLFTDADTWHAPDLLGRALAVARRERADLFSVAGEQEMHTFWERIIQPQVFAMLSMRYGGTQYVSRARRAADAIANGQFLLLPRASYEALGTHAAVRNRAAEDLALAQACVRAGRRLVLMMAGDRLRTRMYASLDELIRGWGKNIYAGGRHAISGGRVGRALFPVLLVVPWLLQLAPVVALTLAAVGVLGSAWGLWGAVSSAAVLGYFLVLYHHMAAPERYALAFPLGALMMLYIALRALARGNRIEWKGRRYVTH